MGGFIPFKWGRVIPFKWGGGLFHSNGEGLFHSNGEGYSIQMGRVIQIKRGGVYFIQIESANDYIQIILLSKLLSFAKECMIDRLNIIVQEDKALSHAFKHQKLVFINVCVLRLL
jgi:hypothetical protein